MFKLFLIYHANYFCLFRLNKKVINQPIGCSRNIFNFTGMFLQQINSK